MKAFMARASIHATPQVVWDILTDGQRYPEWNRTVARVEGRIAPAQRLTVRVTASPERAFPVRVTAFEPPNCMVWSSGMPLGLFKGVRTYEVRPADSGVEFTMREEYSGLMAPLITKAIPDLQPAFDEFAACLKERAERT